LKSNIVILLFLVSVIVLGNCDASGQFIWTKDSQNPVFSGGGTGAWDNDVNVPFVIFNSDSARYEMWYTASPPGGNIGFAFSSDGVAWNKDANPVLSRSPGTWDSILVCCPCVLRENGQYKMWYTGTATTSGGTAVGTRIGYATSPDGRHWTKYAGNPVFTAGPSTWEAGAVAYCSVIKSAAGYVMFYNGCIANANLNRIGRATSVDGITWQRDTPHNPVLNIGGTGAWDGNVYLPRVLDVGGKYYMWYTAEAVPGDQYPRIGLATSADSGKTWLKYAQNPVLTMGSSGSWDERWVELGSVIFKNSFHMWYDGGAPPGYLGRVGHATASANFRLVPSQYATIQAGINAAVQGDTVLVNEGTYYENIRYNGKKIVVGSRYVLDRDTAHISRTIINGSNSVNSDSGSVVYFVSGEDTTSVLCGFTITGGAGTHIAVPSYSTLEGGGVLCFNSGARLKRNTIIGNTLADGLIPLAMYGAGVSADGPETGKMPLLIMEENVVKGNSATTANDKPIGGVGIELYYMNAILRGNAITDNSGETQSTTRWIAGGGIQHSYGTLTCEGNLIARNRVLGTKLLGPNLANGGGVTTEAVNLDFRRNRVIDNLAQGPASTLGTWGGGILVFADPASELRNVVISGNYFRGNQALGGSTTSGGGIDIWNEKPLIENNIIEKNTAYFGGGIALHGTLSATAAVVVNNTIYDNNATNGGGASFRDGAITVAFNNIFWLDSASSNREIHGASGTVNVNNCNVAGGYAGTDNINVDPIFADSTFRLSDRSKCIGAGADSVQIGSVWYREPRTCFYDSQRPNPAGSKPDIGACENARATPLTGVLETRPGLPTIFTLEQNYPNPFNPTTVVSFQLPVVSKVRLVVYDLLGREVAVLVNERKMPGRYELKFDASGLASGVYLYRLTVGSFVQTRKMIVLK
jgi:predicted GH43/DUF377 family glycosyl hydrolase